MQWKASSIALGLLGLLTISTTTRAAVITVSSGSPPPINNLDVANLVADTSGDSLWNDRPVQGQTFTTSPTAGYLFSITVLLRDDDPDPPAGILDGWKDWTLRFGTPSGLPGTLQSVAVNQVARYDADAPTGSYFTFHLDSPIALAASTTYAFDIGVDASEEGWPQGIPSIRKSGDTYSGGQRYAGVFPNQFGQSGEFDINGVSGDLIFHADIAETIPLPAPLVMGAAALGMLGIRRRIG